MGFVNDACDCVLLFISLVLKVRSSRGFQDGLCKSDNVMFKYNFNEYKEFSFMFLKIFSDNLMVFFLFFCHFLANGPVFLASFLCSGFKGSIH